MSKILNKGVYSCMSKATAAFSAFLNADNCGIVYQADAVYKSWQPGRDLNPITGIVPGIGYIIVIIEDNIDVSAYFASVADLGGGSVNGFQINNFQTAGSGFAGDLVYKELGDADAVLFTHTIPVGTIYQRNKADISVGTANISITSAKLFDTSFLISLTVAKIGQMFTNQKELKNAYQAYVTDDTDFLMFSVSTNVGLGVGSASILNESSAIFSVVFKDSSGAVLNTFTLPNPLQINQTTFVLYGSNVPDSYIGSENHKYKAPVGGSVEIQMPTIADDSVSLLDFSTQTPGGVLPGNHHHLSNTDNPFGSALYTFADADLNDKENPINICIHLTDL